MDRHKNSVQLEVTFEVRAMSAIFGPGGLVGAERKAEMRNSLTLLGLQVPSGLVLVLPKAQFLSSMSHPGILINFPFFSKASVIWFLLPKILN